MKVLTALAALLGSWATASAAEPGGLAADSWVEPMRAVHAKFAGQQGTVACFGDSITITMAFFTPLQYGLKDPGDLKEAHDWLKKYVQPRCWRDWKGPEWGNEGRTTTDWGLKGIDGWLGKTNPEVALVMWGTNDTYAGPSPPKYTDNLRAIIQKCLDHGTVPILYTIPPRGDQTNNPKATKHVESFVEAARTVAAEKKVPLIDFYQEIMARQPKDFAKTLLGDNLHPSFPKEYQSSFSEEALRQSGYTLRNYLTLRKLYEVYQKALAKTPSARAAAAVEAAPQAATFQGRPAVFVPKLAAAPAVDGKLDDACWKDVPSLAFRFLDGDAKPPQYRTEARIATAGETLYVAFACSEPDKLVSRTRERNDSVWEDDSVEVFLRPGPEGENDYRHLIVNAGGSILTALGSETPAWQPKVQVATAKAQGAWTVEIAISFAELKVPDDKAKLAGPWRLNLTRMRPARGESPLEDTALAPTESSSNHVPAMFAYAFFEAFGGKLPAPK